MIFAPHHPLTYTSKDSYTMKLSWVPSNMVSWDLVFFFSHMVSLIPAESPASVQVSGLALNSIQKPRPIAENLHGTNVGKQMNFCFFFVVTLGTGVFI